MKTTACLFTIVFMFLLSAASAQQKQRQSSHSPTASMNISFSNLFHNQPIVLNDSMYTNVFGESFSLSKLSYYVSNICFFTAGKKIKTGSNCFLINQRRDSAMNVAVHLPVGSYDSIGFLLGVDSIHNISGAQLGALDPLNDMFWTWNTGYIMQKIEGRSLVSNMVNNKMEYHIGGFKGQYNVLHFITLPFSAPKKLLLQKGKTNKLMIAANIDRLWKNEQNFRITTVPVCTTPGASAKQIASYFADIFSLVKIDAVL